MQSQTYGIPSVSSLLVATGELADQTTASKRTADTGVLLLEFALNKPSSIRSRTAIARMNYLHSRYQKAGKIKDLDMLYTLGVFALEPVRWINSFEWRSFTEFELCAAGTYWKAMGDAMGIPYDSLPSFRSGWKDGLHWLEEIQAWSLEYEKQHMIPAKSNNRLANAHLDVLFINVPKLLLPTAKRIVSVLLGERIRQTMMLPQPSSINVNIITGILKLRMMLFRHLALPRPQMLRKNYISDKPDPCSGRYSSTEYLSHPWYVKPTLKRRWGPRALVTRCLGRKVPGDDGDRYIPQGYRIAEVGPAAQISSGRDAMANTTKNLEGLRFGSCPFASATGAASD